VNDTERRARITLACLFEPGNARLGRLLADRAAAEILDDLIGGADDNGALAELREQAAARSAVTPVAELADRALAATERIGARCVVPGDADWPAHLEDLKRISNNGGDASRLERDTYPPLCLWVRGDGALASVLDRSVAIVGARAATQYGHYVAAEMGHALGSAGWTVVSGGAYGIDSAAHRGALAAGAPTVAVLACGVDRIYPQGNAALFEQIASDGLIVSEWPPGAQPHRHRFLIRNRVIAAATRGTVMVEAAARSGAVNTLVRARVLGRPAMAVPGPVTSTMSAGCHIQLRNPAVRLVTGAAEVLEEIGRLGDDLAPVPRGPVKARDALSPAANQLLDAVRRTPAGVEQLAAEAGLTLRATMQCLTELMVNDCVERTDTGYRLARPAALPPPD
jgi:DNA processing protein